MHLSLPGACHFPFETIDRIETIPVFRFEFYLCWILHSRVFFSPGQQEVSFQKGVRQRQDFCGVAVPGGGVAVCVILLSQNLSAGEP